MNNKNTLKWYIWSYIVLFFFIVLYGFQDSGGTDFERQLFALRSYEKENITYMIKVLLWENDQKVLYHIIYNFLHNLIGIGPRLYIALITLAYYCLLIAILYYYSKKDYTKKSESINVSELCFFTVLSSCPILFTISRNFFAVTFLYIGFLLLVKKKYLLALIPIILALFVHEGIKIMYAIMAIGFALYYFWLKKSKSNFIRNVIIITVSVALFVVGSSSFSAITSFGFEQGLLSENYMDRYGTSKAGDGIYKFVIVLSMLGSLICLFVNCLLDKRNNLIYGVTVAGLFVICLLYNQKIFLIQRIMMFMPIFIGLTSYQICSDYKRKEGEIKQLYILIMWLVPLNVLFQFAIQFNLYFGNFFR